MRLKGFKSLFTMNITLLDGRELTVYPKAEQPEKIELDEFGLDKTGQYLSIGNRKFVKPSQTIIERGLSTFKIQMFLDNAWFLFENAEIILNDSRMFLAPVGVKSGLAYVGEGGFRNPTVGIYLEWWLNHKEVSRTSDGNLIWYIAGSPLSGMHGCSSVSADGTIHKEDSLLSFSKVWHTFIDVNKRYTEAKQLCQSHSLEELLIKLRGEFYTKELDALRQECIDLAVLYNNKPNWPADGTHQKKLVKTARRYQMQIKWREIMDFYAIFSEKEAEMKHVRDHGDTDRYRTILHELAEQSTAFVNTAFGNNINRICLTDVINFAKSRLRQNL